MKLIALTGQMGSGKSTAMSLLSDLLDSRLVNVKFAQPLYDMQELLYKRISSVYQRPIDFIKDRKLLQFLGTNWGRDTISKTIWLDLWKNETQYILENAPEFTVAADDVRFDNEADTVKEMGGIIILIRSKKTSQRIDTAAGIAGHPSEAGISLSKVDYVIDNDGSIEDLKEALAYILAKA